MKPTIRYDPVMHYWRFYDGQGNEVAVVTDEAYCRAGLGTPRDIVLASS